MNDHRTLLKELKKKGYTIHKRTNHLQVRSQGRYVTTMPSTPSDYRGMLNVKSNIKRFERTHST